jgi:hypothetical protein
MWRLLQVNATALQHAVIAQSSPAGVHSWQIWSAPHSSGEQHAVSAQLSPLPAQGTLHAPPWQVVPSGQTTPQAPQFALSVCSSMHSPPQQAIPSPHDEPSGAVVVPHVPSTQVSIWQIGGGGQSLASQHCSQAPPQQTCPVGQPSLPWVQHWSSGMHASPHGSKPSPQTHWPPLHVVPAGHWLPQRPQF